MPSILATALTPFNVWRNTRAHPRLSWSDSGYIGLNIPDLVALQGRNMWSQLSNLRTCLHDINYVVAIGRMYFIGDRMGAQRLSAEALRLNRVGLGLGITFNIIYITAMVVALTV